MDWNDRKTKAAGEVQQHTTEERHEHLSAREGMIESAVDEFAKNGGFNDLTGKGKPIKIEEGDVLTSILKNANVQPPWIELRKEIAADLKRVADRKPPVAEMEAELEAINQKIRKYNRLVPNSLLQKGLVSAANVESACEKWV